MGSFTLVHPQVLLRSWSDEILDSFHVLMLKLSIAMDLAKYLDFPSAEVVHFPHQTWFPKTGPFRSLPLAKWTRSNLSSHYHQLSKWLSSSNLYDQGRAHIAKWLHCKLSQHLASKSLCAWVAYHKWDTQAKSMALCNYSTIDHHSSPIPPRRFIDLVVLLRKT